MSRGMGMRARAAIFRHWGVRRLGGLRVLNIRLALCRSVFCSGTFSSHEAVVEQKR